MGQIGEHRGFVKKWNKHHISPSQKCAIFNQNTTPMKIAGYTAILIMALLYFQVKPGMVPGVVHDFRCC